MLHTYYKEKKRETKIRFIVAPNLYKREKCIKINSNITYTLNNKQFF